jgi:hypothetical protein
MSAPDLDDEYDEPLLDDAVRELTGDELAAALDWLHERDPLAFYPTPVTRRSKPHAYGRQVVDVLPSL